jgi:hypothetical protein
VAAVERSGREQDAGEPAELDELDQVRGCPTEGDRAAEAAGGELEPGEQVHGLDVDDEPADVKADRHMIGAVCGGVCGGVASRIALAGEQLGEPVAEQGNLGGRDRAAEDQ